MEEQHKNLLLATVLSMLVILVWFVLFPPETVPPSQPVAENGQPLEGGLTPPASTDAQAAGGAGTINVTGAPVTAATRDEALAASTRIRIENPRLTGSLSLTGGRIDDLSLRDYRETQDEGADLVTLFSPAGSEHPYFAVYGWAPTAGLDPALVPDASTPWQLESGDVLTQTSPVTLVWDNGAGLIFRRLIELDGDYMFHITQSVENTTDQALRLSPYGVIARRGLPDLVGFYILHEGVVRAQDGSLEEIKFSKMPDFRQVPGDGAIDRVDVEANGWIGFTEKYWMSTLIPEPGQAFASVAKYVASGDLYQVDMRLPTMDIPPGQTTSIEHSLFAGAKEARTIGAYEREMGIANFYDSIDWGWFYFLTKPIFWLLALINDGIGNMGWSIIGLTLVIKTLLFPLAYKSYVSMSRMKKLQPEMEKIKERVGSDRQKMQQEIMALYRKEKVNPAAGCLPILLQIPIFFSLYKVLFVTIEMRHAPFFGWVTDLSAPDPSSWLNLFGILPYSVDWAPVIISIGIWPILMGVTMWLQMKLNPMPTDKTQAMIFNWMPWLFMFLLGSFASGLVIYWVANNTITFIQQYTIMRTQGVKPDIWGNIRGKNVAPAPALAAAKPASNANDSPAPGGAGKPGGTGKPAGKPGKPGKKA